MQVLMLQHGDFFENLAVAAATVPRESFAADEKLRDSFLLVISPNISGDMVFVRTPSFSWRASVSAISLSHPICRRLIK